MATRAITVTPLGTNTRLATWSGLLNGDDGEPLTGLDYADCSVQFGGTFGVGGTVVWEGSNDGATYATLNDAQATAISKTAAGLEQVVEACRYVRPRVTGGDGTTSMVVTAYIRRGR
jgi:hypothetical protein